MSDAVKGLVHDKALESEDVQHCCQYECSEGVDGNTDRATCVMLCYAYLPLLITFLAIVDVEHNLEICHLLTYVSAAGTRGISPTFQLPGEAKQRKRIQKYTKDERRTRRNISRIQERKF